MQSASWQSATALFDGQTVAAEGRSEKGLHRPGALDRPLELDNLVVREPFVVPNGGRSPFFNFVLEQSKDEGAVWLRISGPEGVKAFIREEFGL